MKTFVLFLFLLLCKGLSIQFNLFSPIKMVRANIRYQNKKGRSLAYNKLSV